MRTNLCCNRHPEKEPFSHRSHNFGKMMRGLLQMKSRPLAVIKKETRGGQVETALRGSSNASHCGSNQRGDPDKPVQKGVTKTL
jgi:hypothetical protein